MQGPPAMVFRPSSRARATASGLSAPGCIQTWPAPICAASSTILSVTGGGVMIEIAPGIAIDLHRGSRPPQFNPAKSKKFNQWRLQRTFQNKSHGKLQKGQTTGLAQQTNFEVITEHRSLGGHHIATTIITAVTDDHAKAGRTTAVRQNQFQRRRRVQQQNLQGADRIDKIVGQPKSSAS